MSTTEVAALAGVSVRSIQAWEAGKLPSPSAMDKLHKAFGQRKAAWRQIEIAWRHEKAAANAKRRGVKRV